MTDYGFCPQCGTRRTSSMRYCTRCGLDLSSVSRQDQGVIFRRVSQPTPAAAVGSVPPSAERPESQTLPILCGVAWIIGAAALGYLAFLQFQYSQLGFADSPDIVGVAIVNGLSALITVYFGAMAIVNPTPGRMRGAVLWSAINVVWGVYQVSQGVTHPAFLLTLVAFGVAGVLAFASWNQLRGAGATL